MYEIKRLNDCIKLELETDERAQFGGNFINALKRTGFMPKDIRPAFIKNIKENLKHFDGATVKRV